jgi:hypothetical protein
MLKFSFLILTVFFLSCKNDLQKKVLYNLSLYTSTDDFYNQLDKLASEKIIHKIKSEKIRGIYYAKYTDTISTFPVTNKYEPANKNYLYYGIIVPLIKNKYVEEIRVYFLREINESFADFYERFYLMKNAYFWSNWEMDKDPYLKIIDNLNSKYDKWTIKSNDCNTDMLDPRLPFTPRCATYKWFHNGVQIKFVQSWEEQNLTQSLHIEYALDSMTQKNKQKEIQALINSNEKDMF